MFNDIGALELVTLVILAVLVFGPDKLPKVIQDVSQFIRKIRDFSDNAKQDIRGELGPEFKDFEFEDLNPKTFLRKQLNSDDELRELRELGSSFDLRKEMSELAEGVKGGGGRAGDDEALEAATRDPFVKRDVPEKAERPPFDADTT
ncbi:sec-independent translocase [Streptomyces sp. NPDC057638]|uniref:sec-independent translocase n=1 Tax=Streptomyces sp. NPDC057638 TaxID=3346190 RepID=UPI0036C66BB6